MANFPKKTFQGVLAVWITGGADCWCVHKTCEETAPKKEKDALASSLDLHFCGSRELLLPLLAAGPIAGQHVRIALALDTS